MGIKDVLPKLRDITDEVTLSSLRGERIAVDVACQVTPLISLRH